jgi:hypothetical protein
MADYWMKLYIEILDDPKMATMPDRAWRRTIELFLVAKKLNKDGHLPETRQIAWLLRMSAEELEHDLIQIASTGIIIQEVGGWFIPKFMERQSAISGAERISQFRERQQKQEYYGDVTNEKRKVTQNTEADNRIQNTEAELKNKKKKSASPPIVFPSNLNCTEFMEAWINWDKFRTEIKHKLTPTTIDKQLAMLAEYPVETAIAMIDKSIEQGWQGLFPLKTNGNGNNGENGQHIPKKKIEYRKVEINGESIYEEVEQ